MPLSPVDLTESYGVASRYETLLTESGTCTEMVSMFIANQKPEIEFRAQLDVVSKPFRMWFDRRVSLANMIACSWVHVNR